MNDRSLFQLLSDRHQQDAEHDTLPPAPSYAQPPVVAQPPRPAGSQQPAAQPSVPPPSRSDTYFISSEVKVPVMISLGAIAPVPAFLLVSEEGDK